jgi:hypothetical protein
LILAGINGQCFSADSQFFSAAAGWLLEFVNLQVNLTIRRKFRFLLLLLLSFVVSALVDMRRNSHSARVKQQQPAACWIWHEK